MHLKVFLLLALVPYLCCGTPEPDGTPAPTESPSTSEPPNSEETSTGSSKETSTQKSKKTSIASSMKTSATSSKKTSARTSTRRPTRTSTGRSTRPRTTLGWSDENYDVTDSRSPDRYYGSGYGEDRYNDRDDRYDNDRDGYGNGNRKNNDRYDDDDGENYDVDQSRSPRRKRIPDEYGNMNIYVRDTSSKYGKTKKYKKMRFPVNRFKPGHFPPLPPLISFFPWLPIFADRLTKQTIIFSPTGGLYIIPPVINFYGKLFSVAELIASGYASLVSTGAPPPAAINVAPLVRPGAVAGPGIPPTNTATGGFSGGVQTSLGSVPSSNSKLAGSKGSYGY